MVENKKKLAESDSDCEKLKRLALHSDCRGSIQVEVAVMKSQSNTSSWSKSI